MADNVADNTLTNAALKIPDKDVQDTICKAFRAAWEKWCKKKKPRGLFNNQFFRSLRNTRPNGRYIAQNTLREVPAIATVAAGTAARTAPAVSVSLASSLAATNPAAAAISGAYQAVNGLATAALGSSGALFRMGVNPWQFLGRLGQAGQRLRFLDGLVGTPGRSLEIKGPFDTPRDQQLEDNAKLDAPNKGFSADENTCYKKAKITPPPCPR